MESKSLGEYTEIPMGHACMSVSDRETDLHQTDRQTDLFRQTDRPFFRQTDRQTIIQTDRHTDRPLF